MFWIVGKKIKVLENLFKTKRIIFKFYILFNDSQNVIVGPNSWWPWPIYSLGPKARAEKGYSSGSVIQVQNSLGAQSRTIQSSACPRSHRKEGQKRYRNSLGKNLKYLC